MHKPNMTATGVNNDSLSIIARTAVQITLGGHVYRHCIYVAEHISHQVILGTDFLAKLGEVGYDFTNCRLKVKGETIPMGDRCMQRKVKLAADVAVPPLSEVMAIASIENGDMDGFPCFFQGDNSQGPKTVLYGKAISRVEDRSIAIPIINTTAIRQNVTINTVIGMAEPVDEEDIMLTQTTGPTSHPNRGSALFGKDPAAYLKQEKTGLDNTQMGRLRALINEYYDVVGESVSELGRTDLVEHVIETEPNTAPIRSRPYNIPVGLKTQVKAQIDEMLQQGLITMSTGNCLSLSQKEGQNLSVLRRL